MAYYYRKRRYKKQDDGLGDILAVSSLAVLGYTYTTASDYIARHPYGLAIVIAVAVVLVALVATLLVRRLLRMKHMYDAITVAAVDTMDGLEFE